jgi:sugar-specific transcriptional regulator TrmB
MSVDERQVQAMMELGLNSYEAKAYLALMGRDSFTAPQVADRSGVPRQRIYDVLTSLTERGLAITKPNKRGAKYAAVAPNVALTALVEREKARVAKLSTATDSLVTTLLQAYREGQEEHSPLDYIEVLRGTQAIHQRFSEIQENCEREILIFTKPPYATPVDQNESGLSALKRNIQARSLYELEALGDPATLRALSAFTRQGEEARFVAHLPLKLVIVDEAIVMVAMEDPIGGRTDLTIMVIENSQLAHLMKTAFEAVWAQGLPLAEAQAQWAEKIAIP